jgi:hypothetical protein
VKLKKWCVVFSLLLVAGFAVSLISQSGGRTSSTTGTALAADLQNGFGATCNGTGNFHFVNNQNDGVVGPITVTFICNGVPVTIGPMNPSKITPGVIQFNVPTLGNCILTDASTGDVPGNLVLSDFTCSPTPTPTPTPTKTPTPTPTSTPKP